MKTTGKATQTKATKKGVSFIARIDKTKTASGLRKLLLTASDFPAVNPQTIRRRKRAIVAKFATFGETVRVKSTLQLA